MSVLLIDMIVLVICVIIFIYPSNAWVVTLGDNIHIIIIIDVFLISALLSYIIIIAISYHIHSNRGVQLVLQPQGARNEDLTPFTSFNSHP